MTSKRKDQAMSETPGTENTLTRRECLKLSAPAVGALGSAGAAAATAATPETNPPDRRRSKYDAEYARERLNRIAFPLGGLGAGMICLEGTGALSHV